MYTIKCSVDDIEGKDGKARLKNELERLNGVKSVGVNLETGTVEIGYDKPESAEKIKSLIEHTGHRILYE